jgi:hypothetical protein
MSLRSLRNDLLNERAQLEEILEGVQMKRRQFLAGLEKMEGEIEELEYRLTQLTEADAESTKEED